MKKKPQKKNRIARKTSKTPLRPIKKIVHKLASRITRKRILKRKTERLVEPVTAAIQSQQPFFSPVPKPKSYELPEHYGENRLVLLVRDPWWLYAYWEVTPERDQEALRQIHRSELSSPHKVLRVYDVMDKTPPEHHNYFDIEIGFAENWYVDVGKPDRQWYAEIGFRTREGRFFTLVSSNVVRTPRFGVSDVLDEEWLLPEDLYWKIFGLSGGISTQKSSLAVKEILERYLRGLGASENSPNFSPHSKSNDKDARLILSPEAVLQKH